MGDKLFNPSRLRVASMNLRRTENDIEKLRHSFQVSIPNASDPHDIFVKLPGPADSLYSEGSWVVHIRLPTEYPFKSPSIGFSNQIFHPNVDQRSGSICLDIINQTWSPVFDLVGVVDLFLPQLLQYPNPSDPLNREAAELMMQDKEAYDAKVRELTRVHADPSKVQLPEPAKPAQSQRANREAPDSIESGVGSKRAKRSSSSQPLHVTVNTPTSTVTVSVAAMSDSDDDEHSSWSNKPSFSINIHNAEFEL